MVFYYKYLNIDSVCSFSSACDMVAWFDVGAVFDTRSLLPKINDLRDSDL